MGGLERIQLFRELQLHMLVGVVVGLVLVGVPLEPAAQASGVMDKLMLEQQRKTELQIQVVVAVELVHLDLLFRRKHQAQAAPALSS